MKLSFLVSVALALCLSSTGLFLAGLVEPHWLEGHDVNGAFYYGPFLFCQHGDCFAWSDMQTKDDETDRRLLGPKRHLPAAVGIIGVMLCMNMIALAGSNAMLLWFVWRAPTLIWARNALECMGSGVTYGIFGTTIFLVERTLDTEVNVTLGWSVTVVITALVSQVVAILCVCIPVHRKELLTSATESSANFPFPSPPHTAPPIVLDTSPAAGPGWPQKTRMSIHSDKGARHTGPELLRMLQLYKQHNMSTTSLMNRAIYSRRQNEAAPQRTDQSVDQPMDTPQDLTTEPPPNRQLSIELSRFSSQLETAVKNEESKVLLAKLVTQAVEMNGHVERSVAGGTDPGADNPPPQQQTESAQSGATGGKPADED